MEARRKEEEKHNDQLEADRKAARTLQEKLNEENRMLREQIGKKEFFFFNDNFGGECFGHKKRLDIRTSAYLTEREVKTTACGSYFPFILLL